MIIAIDYDDTFTADPAMWRALIHRMRKTGHIVICATSRFRTFENRREIEAAFDEPIVVVFADHGFKEDATKKAGFQVDVWIDDRPQCIRPLGSNDL